MAPTEPCPSTRELEEFLGQHETDGRVAAHAARCDACRQRLKELRTNNELLARVVEANLHHEASGLDGESSSPPCFTGTIEGYDVAEEIHRGAQGVVYHALHRATNRRVAMKVLLDGVFATSRQRRRFEREIELVAALSHPNVVTVHDSGITDDGRHYFAMQYVRGVPLDEWIQTLAGGAPRSLREMIRLFLAICGGVNHAHQHGVIHRDLKPANIIVDEEDEPHILDFGLARPIDDVKDQVRAAVTQEGEFLGTLAYCSPEQTSGDPSLIDTRSDVYALGVILYEMLAGHLPHPMDGDLTSTLTAIAHTEPLPMQVRRRERTTPSRYRIDRDLETIVLKTLAKDKGRRYQSVGALRDDLQRYLDGRPIEARRDSAWYVLGKTLSLYRVPASIAVVFVVLLITFAVMVMVKNHRIRTEAEKLSQINLFLEDTLGSVQPSTDGEAVIVRDLLDEAVLWIDIALADQPEVAAAIQTTIGNSYRNLGLLEEAEVQLAAAMRTRREILGAEHKQVAQSLNVMGLLRADQGRTDEAETLLTEALVMRQRLLGDESYEVSLSLANLALLMLRTEQHARAEQLLLESRAIRERIFGPVHQDVAMCLYNLGQVSEATGDLDTARERHERALSIRRRVLSPQHPDLQRSVDTIDRLGAGGSTVNEQQ